MNATDTPRPRRRHRRVVWPGTAPEGDDSSSSGAGSSAGSSANAATSPGKGSEAGEEPGIRGDEEDWRSTDERSREEWLNEQRPPHWG